jgi:hypothetical protein
MNEQQALDALEEIRAYLGTCLSHAAQDSRHRSMFDQWLRAIDLAMDAMRARVAVPPIWREDKPHCGGCGLQIDSHKKYCPTCGRRVSWAGRRVKNQ